MRATTTHYRTALAAALRLHMQKLEQLKEARRRGLPIQFEFDPADGPMPPVYYHVDGVDYP